MWLLKRMGKRKNKAAPAGDAEDEEDSKLCEHVKKGVKSNVLRKSLPHKLLKCNLCFPGLNTHQRNPVGAPKPQPQPQQTTVPLQQPPQPTQCCVSSPQGAQFKFADGGDDNDGLCVCLKCGHVGCDRMSMNRHATIHHRQEVSLEK
jgi:hypothetical protein